MSENYLVTGGTGFVGSQIVRRLVKKGKNVHVISRKPHPNWRLSDIKKEISFHSVDLQDKNLPLLFKKIRPTYVFHLASYGSLPKESYGEKMVKTNILGTINLVSSLDFTSIKRFINTGSSSEYGVQKRALKETDQLLPLNDYAFSKASQTLYCQKESLKNNLPITTLRLFSPFGYFEEKTRLIPHVILNSLKNKNIPLSSPSFVRDFVFIEDVVDAYLTASRKNVLPGEVINVGSGRQNTIQNITDAVIRLSSSTSTPLFGMSKKQDRQIEPIIWKADITKAKKLLQWEPTYSLEEGLSKTIHWFKKNQTLYA